MRKGFYLTDLVKYLGIKIDQSLTWRNQINIVAAKINRAHAMMSKIIHFMGFKSFNWICYAIFETHLNYLWLVWAQNGNSVKKRLA